MSGLRYEPIRPSSTNCQQPRLSSVNRRAFALLVAAVCLCGALTASATSYFSRATGNWNTNTTWSLTSGGVAVGAGIYPVAGDTVTIEGGFNVAVTNDAACSSVTFTTATATTLSINTGITLTVSGAVTIPRSGAGVNVLAVGAGNLNAASIAFTSGGGNMRHQITISTGRVTVSGNVTQAGSSGSATITFTGAGLLRLGGTFLTSATGALMPSTGTVEYNAAGSQTVGNFAYNNLILSGSGIKTITGAIVNGTLSMEGTATTTGSITTYGVSATLQYNGSAAQTTGTELPATWSGSGGFIITNSSGVTLGAARIINAPLNLAAGTFTVTPGLTMGNATSITRDLGSLSAAPTFGASVNVIYTGSAAVNSGPEIPTAAAVLNNLTMNKSGGVTLTASPTINGTLTLTSGDIITTGSYQLNLVSGATVSGGSISSYVYGTVQKAFSTGAGQSFIFPVGDSSSFEPVSLSSLSPSVAGSIKVSTTNGNHPNLGNSQLDPSADVAQYWTLANVSGTYGSFTANFIYPAGESSGLPSTYVAMRYGAGTWVSEGSISGLPTSTNTTISNVIGFGDFAIGTVMSGPEIDLLGTNAASIVQGENIPSLVPRFRVNETKFDEKGVTLSHSA